jgi:hypothetical protein
MIKNYIILLLLVLLLVVLGTKLATAPRAEGAEIVEEFPPILLEIAKCESGDRAYAKNPNSSASGRFQFIRSSWEYYGRMYWGDEWANKDVFDWEDNTELALFVYKLNGTRDWDASRHCWGT